MTAPSKLPPNFCPWGFDSPITPLQSTCGEIEEDNARRIADRRVVTGKGEPAGPTIHLEDGDAVGSLIAAIEKLASGVEVEASRIVPSRPFFPDKCKLAFWANREDPDAVMQPGAPVNASSVH